MNRAIMYCYKMSSLYNNVTKMQKTIKNPAVRGDYNCLYSNVFKVL